MLFDVLSLGQVDLLRRVQHYFGTCVNGKATLTGAEEQLPDEKPPGLASGPDSPGPVVFSPSPTDLAHWRQFPDMAISFVTGFEEHSIFLGSLCLYNK